MKLKLKTLPYELTICKLPRTAPADLSMDFCFAARTDEELSLVCETAHTPPDTTAREDGWRAFRIEGVLDFSLTGRIVTIEKRSCEEKD